MQTAANATTGKPPVSADWQRATGGPKSSATGAAAHVLARLPDLRAAMQGPAEPQAASEPPRAHQPVSQPAASAPPRAPSAPAPKPAPVEIPDALKSEFFEPQGLPAMGRAWQDTRQWFSKHAKVAMFIIALLASHSFMLIWRQPPPQRQDQAMQPLGDLLEAPPAESNQLHPIPMESDVGGDRVPAADTAATPVIDEPHLALPRPQPDPISTANTPHLTPSEEPVEQPKLAVVLKRNTTPAKPADPEPPQDALSSAPAKPAAPIVPAVDDKDVPPWESWSDKKESTAAVSPAVEAAASAAPTLAPPDGSSTVAPLPDEARTASLAADRPSSRAGSMQRPQAVAKLKGTINKPVAEPANERTRRSLY